ncbi:MAG: pyridoxal phosphate-dependent aminotransferase [Rhodospirillales bacterium]|jgi:aspartate aminotransferase|nr:pyridoxal phosphate-dependent aminotransferase [Rhodospirillales bacterium]
MIALATWLGQFAPSALMAINKKTRELKAAGVDVISLSIGAPDFETPENAKRGATDAIGRGDTRYTNVDGTAELKAAIQEKFRRENGLDYALDQISVGTGAKQVVFNALMATLNAGDEVIVPAPYYASYPDIARIAGAVPRVVTCPAESGFKLTPAALEGALTGRSRWLVLNSPGNPSGAVYDQGELAALAQVLRRHPTVAVLSDDIYEHFLYDGAKFATMAQVAPDMADRTLTVNGVSKTYGMTGWRIGYAGGPSALIRAMARIQYQCTTSPCSVSQAAAVSALLGSQDQVTERMARFEKRRDLVVGLLNAVDGLDCLSPRGSFYAYPACAGLMGKRAPDGGTIDNDADLASYILEAERVSVLPGAAYGLSPHLRISFANDEDALTEGCARIARACSALE